MGNLLLNEKRKTFDVFESALACVIFIVLNFLFLQIYYALPVEMKSGPLFYIAQFLIEALFGVAAWIVATTRKVDIIKATGMNKKVNYKIVLYGLAIAICSLLFFALLTIAFMDFLIIVGYTPLDSGIKIDNFGIYLVYVVATCAAPALFEELLFRGVILSGFKGYGKKIALICSSFIFMIMHGTPDQTIHQFIVGFILGWIFIDSGNLWLGAIVHFFNNFISVTQMFIMSFFDNGSADVVVEETTGVPFNPWPSFIFELILAIILAIAGYFVISYLVKKILKENELINGKESDDKVEVAVISPEVVGVEDVADGATTATNTDENNALSINDSQFEISNKEFEIDENDYKVESIENVENTEGETNNENQTLVEGEKKEESVSISEEKKPMGMGTMVMFMLSGIYLVFNWLLVLINGFMI